MTGAFACPECGRELAMEGLTAGRQIQCDHCLTWVEVPFLPRAAGWKRGQKSRSRPFWKSKTLRAAVIFAGITMLGLTASQMIAGRVRAGQEQVLSELVASADEAEAAHRYDIALREIEGAVAQARKIDRDGSDRIAELLLRRHRTSVREAETRLAAVDALDPDRAVGESLTLAHRAKNDFALEALADAIESKLVDSRRRQAEVDLSLAHHAFDESRDTEAFVAASRLHTRAGKLPVADASRFRDEAEVIIHSAVSRSGVALPPVAGRFVAGSAEAYTAALDRLRSDAFRQRGYLPQVHDSPWSSIWDEKAPFRARIHVVETRNVLYLQSKNRTTQVDATIELTHEGRSAWQARVFVQTRVPLLNLPAYEAGHLATAARRDPLVERRLHDDAVLQFIEQATRSLRGIPAREVAEKR